MRKRLKSFKAAATILKQHKPPFTIRHGKEWNDKGDLCRSQLIVDADDKKCLLILTAAYRADVYTLTGGRHEDPNVHRSQEVDGQYDSLGATR